MKKRHRDYKKEAAWEDLPEQVAERVARNKARRTLMRQGKVHKGDNMEVDHSDSNPMHNVPSNWKVISKRANRRKNKHDRS